MNAEGAVAISGSLTVGAHSVANALIDAAKLTYNYSISGSRGTKGTSKVTLADLRAKGDPYPDHTVDCSGKDLPAKGKPNSSVDKLNPDGTVKQRRYYGPDGKAQEDIDYNHSNGDNTHTFPHRHIWYSSKNPPRQ